MWYTFAVPCIIVILLFVCVFELFPFLIIVFLAALVWVILLYSVIPGLFNVTGYGFMCFSLVYLGYSFRIYFLISAFFPFQLSHFLYYYYYHYYICIVSFSHCLLSDLVFFSLVPGPQCFLAFLSFLVFCFCSFPFCSQMLCSAFVCCLHRQ